MSLPLEIENRLAEIRQEVEQDGAELIEIVFRRMTGRSILALTVDTIGGITLEQCADINRRLGRRLDEWSIGEAGIQGAYYLEVNSPGLDRPLKTPGEFDRAIGTEVRVTYREGEHSVVTKTGFLKEAGEQGMKLETNGQEWSVAQTSVIKTIKEIKFRK